MTLGVTLRPTGEPDLDLVLQLERDPENSPYVGSWSRSEHLAALSSPDRKHWIIEALPEHRAVGFLITLDLRSTGRGVHLKRIVVSEKGRGFGRDALLLLVRRVFAEPGAPFVWLDVFPDNFRAQASYRKAGFHVRSLPQAEKAAWAEAVGEVEGGNVLMFCAATPDQTMPGRRED